MRLTESSLSVLARNITFGSNSFLSDLPGEAELANVAQDPTASPFFQNQSNPQIASILQRNAVVLAQASQAFAANAGLSGFDSIGGGIAPIAELVGQAAFDHDLDIRSIALGATSVIDDVVEGALDSVPFVGAAAQVVWSLVQLVYGAATKKVELPPLFRMDPSHDQSYTRVAISRVKGEHDSDDWTPIFLPRNRGQWRMIQKSGGIEFAREPYEESYEPSIDRLGCAPGDLFYVDGGVQSRITPRDVTIPSNAKNPTYRNVLQTVSNPEVLHSLVFGLGEWYPSLSAFGRAVWSLVGVRQSAAMFQIDATRVSKEWSQFATATAYFRADMDKYVGRRVASDKWATKDFKRSQIAPFLSNMGAALHTLRARDESGKLRELSQEQLLAAALDPSKRAGDDAVGAQAVKHANQLRKRQLQASKTPLNALVSKNAPALRMDGDLREHFMRHRTQQLDAGKFDGIALDDIPDQGLRNRLVARLRPAVDMSGPNSFVDPVSVERDRRHAAEIGDSLKTIDRPLGFGGFGAPRDPEDETGGGYGLAIAGLAATAAIGGGIAIARRRRARR